MLAHRLQEAGLTRAFADDIAMVLRDLFASFRSVAQIFEEYFLISGLHLNFGKTIVVPLWREQEKTGMSSGTGFRLLAKVGRT